MDKEIKSILENLSDPQRSLEKKLRTELLEEYKNRGKSPFEIGRRLAQLHDELIGEKLFKKYLSALGIPRSTAYHQMSAFKELPKLPEPVLAAAGMRGINLAQKKHRLAIQDIVLPENPEEGASKWLDDVLARFTELKAKRSEKLQSTPLTGERRHALTVDMLAKEFRKLGSAVGKLWRDVPPDERSLEVFQSLVDELSARLGFAEGFRVTPAPETSKPISLVKRLEKRASSTRRIGRKMRRLGTSMFTPILPEDGGRPEGVAASTA